MPSGFIADIKILIILKKIKIKNELLKTRVLILSYEMNNNTL